MTHRNFLGRSVAGLASVLLVGLAGPAQAQIAEITVTARKVEESLKDVPLAITAFTSDDIDSAGIENLADVAALTPGLTFFNAFGETLPTPVIRGVAPTDIFGENNAAIFVDGVYVSGREGLNFGQLDIQRIEVVKGPQSAMYGRNAFSGAINFVTKRPPDVFEIETDATAGNAGKVAGSVSIGGPLIGDWLKGRIAAGYDEWDGSYDNPLSDADVGGYRYRSFQGKIEFTPNDDLDILASLYYANDEIDDPASTSVSPNCEDQAEVNYSLWNPATVAPYGSRLANFCGEVWDLKRTNQELNRHGFNLGDDEIPKISRALGEDRELWRASLNIDWDLGFGTVSALTGYSSTEQQALNDGTRNLGHEQAFLYCTGQEASNSFCIGSPTLQQFTTGLLQVQPPMETDEISQEIRFTSPADRALRYSIGGYYYDVNLDWRLRGLDATNPAPGNLGYFCPCSLNILAIGGSTYEAFPPAPPPPNAADPNSAYGAFGSWFLPGGNVDRRLQSERDTNAWAAFGWIEQDFMERFTARVELRYSDEEKEITYNTAVINPVILQQFPDQGQAKDSWDFWTGRVSLDYRVSDDWMLYGSFAKGQKSGAIDTQVVTLRQDDGTQITGVPITVTVEPEKNYAAEIGIKGRTSDGRLGIDLAVYHMDWQDIVLPQMLESDPTTGLALNTPGAVNRNSGDATIWGWELNADLQFTDHLLGRLGVSFTDATLDDSRQDSYALFPSFYTNDPTCTPEAILAIPQASQRPQKAAQCRTMSGDISGNAPLRQSEWQGSATLEYRRQLSGDWDWYTRADATYQGKWYVGSDNQGYIPAHTYVNLRLGAESGRVAVELWGDNIFENDEAIGAFRDVYFGNNSDVLQQTGTLSSGFVADFFPWRLTVTHPKLRTYGITARVRFGGAD